ncbi:MAG TPA: hypothetical protein VHV10_04510 [Ktedonobacteraceae bacterium]|jgi:hypothetical protein|nr:hypothetical protein [Ktedonobacteraceae bacterium]
MEKGKRKKPPFNPHNGKPASTDDSATWGTFDQALARYEAGGYDGIGYVCNGDIVTLDLDRCRNPETGKVEPWAQSIIDRLSPYAYFEISPSETGFRGVLLADLPFNYRKEGPFELSHRSSYVTITGNHLEGTPIDLQSGPDVQNALDEIVTQYFPQRLNVNTGGGDIPTSREPLPISSHNRTIDQVIEKATGAKNGWRFSRLMAGNAQGYKSRSEAHLALCSMSVYWTNGDESQIDQIFRQSGFFDEETAKRWDEVHSTDGSTYGEMTIEKALLTSRDYSLPKPRRQERSIPHVPPAAPRVTIEEHLKELEGVNRNVQEQIRSFLQSPDGSILVELVPPGVGKSHAAAAIGARTTQPTPGQRNLAWIAQRKSMVASVADLITYRQIQPCTQHNCSHHTLHNILGAKGYNTRSVHSKHLGSCDYTNQFRQEGSAVYQMPHINSSYPAQHEGIVIDELDPAAWLPEREVTIEKLHATLIRYPADSTADQFLRVLQGLLTDVARNKQPIHGKAIFDALEKATRGQLVHWLARLDQDPKNRDSRPFIETDPYDTEEEDRLRDLAPVLMPHLLRAFMQELVKWQHGQEWNSCLRIGPAAHGPGYALYMTKPLQFAPGEDGTLPPIVLLDATADPVIHSRLLGTKLTIQRADVSPAPGTRHIAIRTGKRYGKTSLTTRRKDDSTNRDLQRAIAEVKFILQKLDPTGEQIRAGSVGIISFQGCVDAIADALDIPEHRRGHYWGIRGSNHLEDCSILLLVGTPTLRPDELVRQARAIYRDDPDPIRETDPDEYKSTGKHTDPRLQHYAEYTINSELTQAAHRNRALRHENRTVVSLCLGEIDFLPVTETLTELPFLTPEGEDRHEVRHQDEQERLQKAYTKLSQNGSITQSELAKTAKVRKQTAAEWMREHHPPTVFTDGSSHDAIESHYSMPGTSESEITENAPPVTDPLETFWSVGQQRGYPEIADLGLRAGMIGWNSFKLTHRLRIPDVIARLGGVA